MILRKSRYVAFAALAAAGLCLPATARAQTDAPAAETQTENPLPKADEKISLRDVLLKAHLSREGIAVAVGAENVTRTKKELADQNVETINRAAAAFGMLTHDFGQVMMAIGPQTYIELNNDFRNANPFADMPPNETFTLLLATLTDGQRCTLMSKEGLGSANLTSEEQKSLFKAFLPDQEAFATRIGASNGEEASNLGVLRDKASTAHLRIGQETHLVCYLPSNDFLVSITNPTTRPPVYRLNERPDDYDMSKVNGVVMRHTLPNFPKYSELDYDSPRLRVLISITNLKTVGDLVSRVAKQTGIKIYADFRYENRAVTWRVNGRDSASAADLLRAVAFCLPATYRRVGASFVLTESIAGAGQRNQIIQDFEEANDAERQGFVRKAKKSLEENPARKTLKMQDVDNPLALTPAQEKTTRLEYDDRLYRHTDVRFDHLSQSQQDAAQDAIAKIKKDVNISSDTKFNLQSFFKAQMLLPNLAGVIEFEDDFSYDIMSLFCPDEIPPHPTDKEWQAFINAYQNSPSWRGAAKNYACRAVISRPHTSADVDAALTRIVGMGFNQMWIVVFENGKARIPGTPFLLDPACDPKTDLLTYAIAEGKKRGITVCPVVNVYGWGADTPAELCFRTLRGEDSAQNAKRRFDINRLTPPELSIHRLSEGGVFLNTSPPPAASGPVVFVDPTIQTVRSQLLALFKTLNSYSGAGSWICRSWNRDIVVGFSGWFSAAYDYMGYNVGLREAFLKENHCDPIDLEADSNNYYNDNIHRTNTSLTNYEAASHYAELGIAWFKFRDDSLSKAFHALLDTAVLNCGDKKPKVLLAQEEGQGWRSRFDVWSEPPAPFPEVDVLNPSPEQNTSIYFLSKEPEGISPLLPKELQKVDWRDLQMRTLEMLKPYRKWEGIAIEE